MCLCVIDITSKKKSKRVELLPVIETSFELTVYYIALKRISFRTPKGVRLSYFLLVTPPEQKFKVKLRVYVS